ncbi:hypothetical protein NVP1054O_07 [Vibrio phage 1.054.O._10N.261.52.A1]|nr:hypothetical protein NVP1054O_07 [Vibrio phage 1.054.O._10N.261.52.A1]
MKTYNSYAEAKIANPELDIYKEYMSGLFSLYNGEFSMPSGLKCNPADHCMTFNQCDEFKTGMIVLEGSSVVELNALDVSLLNTMKSDPIQRESWDANFILRAAALNKPKRVKVEYVKVEFSREWEAVKYYNEVGELFVIDCCGNYTSVNDISGEWYEVVCKNYMDLYRRIETEITERDEFIEMYAWATQDDKQNIDDIAGMLFDSGKFKLVEE